MHAAADVAPVSILEPPRDGLSQERIDAAAALVQDAQHGRQIHRKSGARHLRLYGLFHSREYKLYIVMVGIINLGLALFEPSARAVPQYVCHTCAAVEFATLVLYSADVLFESRIHVNHFWMRSNWTRAKLFILTASFIGGWRASPAARRRAGCRAPKHRSHATLWQICRFLWRRAFPSASCAWRGRSSSSTSFGRAAASLAPASRPSRPSPTWSSSSPSTWCSPRFWAASFCASSSSTRRAATCPATRALAPPSCTPAATTFLTPCPTRCGSSSSFWSALRRPQGGHTLVH